MKNKNALSLYNGNGQRKYLTSNERERFQSVACTRDKRIQYFLLMLFFSGARISEVLNLEHEQIEYDQNVVIIESLKKRRKGVFRAVPLPDVYLSDLSTYIKQRKVMGRLWPFTRRTASRYVTSVMEEARIVGVQASSKGLRHSFAVSAIEKNVPLNLIRNWMGHCSIETTAIYLNVSGKEERRFAERMWT